jgi:hypothetical protein
MVNERNSQRSMLYTPTRFWPTTNVGTHILIMTLETFFKLMYTCHR